MTRTEHSIPSALVSLARLRRLAVDESRKALAECLTLEEVAERRSESIEAVIAAEMLAASYLPMGDSTVKNFGVWLKQARATAAAAKLELLRTASDTGRARATLMSDHAAAEAVNTLRACQTATAAAAAIKREQSELDEISHHRHSATGRTCP